jgi:hypothetical protein
MNKISMSVVLLMSLNAFAAAKLTKTEFGQWPRARADVFGCFLEKEFGFKDKKFNCSLKDYHNHGDPCKNVDAYVEGPEFPLGAMTQVGADVKSIQLAWEHGDLQSVSVEFQGKKKLDELKKYRLPSDASLQDCTLNTTCVVVEGFDHLGAGDAGCE